MARHWDPVAVVSGRAAAAEARWAEMAAEHGALARDLGAAQARCTRMFAEQARRLEQAQAEVVRLRGALIARETACAALREALEAALASAARRSPPP